VTTDFLDGMSKGVRLPELETTTKPCRTSRVGDRIFRIVLTQGLNRQIRRMCEAFGLRRAAAATGAHHQSAPGQP